MTEPGSLVFCHSKGAVGSGIRWAERIRFRSGAGWNHVAVVAADGRSVIQAGGHGIVRGTLPTIGVQIVAPPGGTYGPKVVEFMEAQIGRKYGFLTIVSILFTLLSPKFIDVMLPDTWICSAVAAEALRYAGWYHSWPDIYQVSPAQLYEVLT